MANKNWKLLPHAPYSLTEAYEWSRQSIIEKFAHGLDDSDDLVIARVDCP